MSHQDHNSSDPEGQTVRTAEPRTSGTFESFGKATDKLFARSDRLASSMATERRGPESSDSTTRAKGSSVRNK